MRSAVGLFAGALVLSGCAGGGVDLAKVPGYGQRSGERMGGVPLRPTANPSEVAATDIAYSRAARDDGQWTAFRRYAADGAVIHGRNGVVEAEPWLAAQDDPEAPVQWTPTAVWSSCDGSTAVSQGKFAEPDGQWGYYVTVWERQRNGRYRWVYDIAAPDDELTAAENKRRDSTPTSENAIVIRAIEAIEGRVAECLPRDQVRAVATVAADNDKVGGGSSDDTSLVWSWSHAKDGARELTVTIDQIRDSQIALSFKVAPDGKHVPGQ